MRKTINIELLSVAKRPSRIATAAAISGSMDTQDLINFCGAIENYNDIALIVTSAYALAWTAGWKKMGVPGQVKKGGE